MELSEVQELYKKTFGSVKNDEQSMHAFIEMLMHFDIISDDEYYSIKNGMAETVMNEAIRSKLKGYVPLFEDIMKDGIDETSYKEIKKLIDSCKYIIVYSRSENEAPIKYSRDYNAFGSAIWVGITEEDEQAKEYDEDYIIGMLFDKIVYGAFGVSRHGDYIDIGKPGGAAYFDRDSTKAMLENFYDEIMGGKPVIDTDWNEFLKYVNDAGIITGEQKIQLLSHNAKE